MRNQSILDAMGWRYLIVWECELGHKEQLENKLLAFLSEGEIRMKAVELFAGAGGLGMGISKAGFKPVEIVGMGQMVLRHY